MRAEGEISGRCYHRTRTPTRTQRSGPRTRWTDELIE